MAEIGPASGSTSATLPGEAPGGVQRRLFFYERFLQVGGRLPWNVILAVRAARIGSADLRAALDRVQAAHPMLQVAVVPGRRPHFETVAAPVPLREAEGSWLDTVAAELERPFDRRQGPLLRAIRVADPAGDVLVLVGDHGICDGRAMRQLVVEVLAQLAGPAATARGGGGIARLDELFAADGRPGVLAHAWAIGWLLRGAGDVARWLRRPRIQGATYMLHWELAQAPAAALRARCDAEGTSVYAALAVALLAALGQVRREAGGRRGRNRLLCPVDVRHRLPGLGPEALFGFPGTIRLSTGADPGQPFWQQARALKADLDRRRIRLNPARMLLSAERLHGIAEWFVTLQLHGRARNDVMFSYLGEAAMPVEAEALAFVASMPWRGATALYAVRDRGRLRFCLVSREENLAPTAADRVRQTMMAAVTVH